MTSRTRGLVGPARWVVLLAVEASLVWSAVLTGLAAVGVTDILDRVAGGYFAGASMPIVLRLLYLAMTVLMLAVMWLEWRLFQGPPSARELLLARVVMVAFTLSTIVNAISQSPPERWNAIPAAVIVLGTVLLIRRSTRMQEARP